VDFETKTFKIAVDQMQYVFRFLSASRRIGMTASLFGKKGRAGAGFARACSSLYFYIINIVIPNESASWRRNEESKT